MNTSFNPDVYRLRLHWFTARPSFDLLNPAGRTPFANTFLSEDRYYQTDVKGEHFRLRRLGRRFQMERRLDEDHNFEAHGFWSLYMSRVAHPDYRGIWRGLAPMRVVFGGDKEAPLLRLDPTFARTSTKARLRVYPNCYLFPIGWTAGMVIQADGNVPLEECCDLAERLGTEKAFLWRGRQACLNDVLDRLHEMIRGELVVTRGAHNSGETTKPYLVLTPLRFDGQESFWGNTLVDRERITTMLAGGPLSEGKAPLTTPNTSMLTITVLNRGTFLMSRLPEHEANVPGCSSSNLKNSLLITTIMQKFHQNSRGHRNPLVVAMRNEVGETFRQMASFWTKQYFLKIGEAHAGIARMREEPMVASQVTNIYFTDSVLNNAAIGNRAQIVDGAAAGNGFAGANQNGPQEGEHMSNITLNNSPIGNAVVGDYGTFNQNVQTMNIEQLASDLKKAQARADTEASTDEQKVDAKNIAEAAAEAAKGATANKGKVAEYLHKVGAWGWKILKEVGPTLASVGLKLAVGL
jgi:hypothetical protein